MRVRLETLSGDSGQRVTVYRFAGRSRFQQFRGPTQAHRLVGRTERLVGGLNLLRLARDDSMDFVAWRASNQLCIVLRQSELLLLVLSFFFYGTPSPGVFFGCNSNGNGIENIADEKENGARAVTDISIHPPIQINRVKYFVSQSPHTIFLHGSVRVHIISECLVLPN